MTTFADRVRTAMEEAGHTQSSLARAVGLTRASISFWLNGQTKEITGDNLLKAASALNVSPVWLAVGRGAKKVAGPTLESPSLATPSEDQMAADAWPFKVSRDDYERLTDRERFILDDLVASFVASCLRSDVASKPEVDTTESISGVIGGRRGRRTTADPKRTGTTE